MIDGFFKRICDDAKELDNYIFHKGVQGKGAERNDQEKRIALVVGRCFSLGGMIVGAFLVLSTPVHRNPTGAVLQLALGIITFVIGHDSFVIFKNETDQLNVVVNVMARAGAVFQDVKDFINGRKKVDDAPRNAVTEGTILRPLWDNLFFNAR